MNILVITYRLPDNLYSGDKYTVHHFVRYLCQRHRVMLLTMSASDPRHCDLSLVAPYCDRVEVIHLPRWRSLVNCARELLGSGPLQVAYYRSRAAEAKLRELMDDGNVDVVYAYHLRSGQYLAGVDRCPKVLDLKPVQSLNLRRMKDHVRGSFKRLLYRLEYHRVKAYEPALVRSCSRCFVISEADRREIDPDRSMTNLSLNPHGLDPDYFVSDPDCEKEPATIVLSGKMHYDPNVDAAQFFCLQILPLIRARVPAVKLYIVGTNPKPEVAALAREPGVVVTGTVDDLRPYLARSQVAVAPMRIGAGLQNKVLEAMSMGLPLVATSVANEGIGATDCEQLLIADSAADFAERVLRLLERPEERRALGHAAREFILKNWTWDRHFAAQEAELLRLSSARDPDANGAIRPRRHGSARARSATTPADV